MSAVSARELAALVVEAVNLEGQDPATLDLSAPLFGDGLGLDSLDMLEISLVIQQRYGVKLKADDPNNDSIFASMQSLADYIGARQAANS
jgi:acyl carrier protein